jgi:hypothetical protein
MQKARKTAGEPDAIVRAEAARILGPWPVGLRMLIFRWATTVAQPSVLSIRESPIIAMMYFRSYSGFETSSISLSFSWNMGDAADRVRWDRICLSKVRAG